MKIRTLNALNDLLSEDLAWRKHELTTLKLQVDKANDKLVITHLRSAVCILYAHWEGFIKSATLGYVNYVSLKRLRYCELSPSFLALGIRKRLSRAGQSSKITMHAEITEFLLSDMKQKAKLQWKDAISTRDNLNYDALSEILTLLCIDKSVYETKKALIDEKLLGNRNAVSHGERAILLDRADYQVLHSEVIDIIDMFSTDIQNSAQQQLYKR